LLPTGARLGAFCVLAVTAEREGLYVSMARVAGFGEPPRQLEAACAAEVDEAVLAESRPGRTLGELFDVLAEAHSQQGFREEWRQHHQSGLTGYRGREFATPGDRTRLPAGCAVPGIRRCPAAESRRTRRSSARGVEGRDHAGAPLLDSGRPELVRL
jgi:hypothetical protein